MRIPAAVAREEAQPFSGLGVPKVDHEIRLYLNVGVKVREARHLLCN